MSLQSNDVALSRFAGAKNFIPPSLDTSGNNVQAINTRREERSTPAEFPSYSTTNDNRIHIALPNTDTIDPRYSYIMADVNLTVTGATYQRLHLGIFSIFQTFRLLDNGDQATEEIIGYNRIYNKWWEIYNNPDATSATAVESMGFGTQAQRNARHAGNATFRYVIPLMSGILARRLLPLGNLQNHAFRIQLTLEDAARCVETDGTNPIITVSNIRFYYSTFSAPDVIEAALAQYAGLYGGVMTMGFHTWRYVPQLLTAGVQSVSVPIPFAATSISWLLQTFRNQAQDTTTTVNNKFLTWLPFNLTEVQLNINNKDYIPAQGMLNCTESARWHLYRNFLMWLDKTKTSGMLTERFPPSVTQTAFIDDKMVIVWDFEAFPEEHSLVSSFSTDINSNTTLICQMNFSVNIPVNTILENWFQIYQQITLYAGGTFTKL